MGIGHHHAAACVLAETAAELEKAKETVTRLEEEIATGKPSGGTTPCFNSV